MSSGNMVLGHNRHKAGGAARARNGRETRLSAKDDAPNSYCIAWSESDSIEGRVSPLAFGEGARPRQPRGRKHNPVYAILRSLILMTTDCKRTAPIATSDMALRKS